MTYDKLKILNKHETNEILGKLQEQFGVKEIPGILVMRGAERIFLFNGDYSGEEITRLEGTIPIERVGVYFAKIFAPTGEIRLSIEGTQILKDQFKKNVFELDNEQAEQWMKGNELLVESKMVGFVIMKHGENYMGCGKASEKKISNFIPKNRRLKEKS